MASERTGIEWTDATWNPIRGCSPVSPGCANCYAPSSAIRQIGRGYKGLVKSTKVGPRWTGEVRFVEHLLDQPLRWREPRRIFVNSMSDLFHEKVEDAWIDRIFAVMALCPQHTFQILTKRAERMRAWFIRRAEPVDSLVAWQMGTIAAAYDRGDRVLMQRGHDIASSFRKGDWPLPNVHLGVSVEDPKTARERWAYLRDTPAAVRWISYEPALAGVDFIEAEILPRRRYAPEIEKATGIYADWIVVGGESGPGARPFGLEWARSTIAQCRAARVPVFVNQLGANIRQPSPDGEPGTIQWKLRDRKGGDWDEWSRDLRVREWPAR